MYLDPGFGSMLIQVLIASFAAAATMFGVFRHKVMVFFRKKKNDTEKAITEENTDDK